MESRCQTESRNSFLTRTHVPASEQMCVEASDTRQTGREKFDALLSSHSGDIQTLTTACWSWREPRRDSFSSAAGQPFSKPQKPHQRSQQIRPADGPRSAQSEGEANSNQLELLTWHMQYVHTVQLKNIFKHPASFFKGPLNTPSIKSEQSHWFLKSLCTPTSYCCVGVEWLVCAADASVQDKFLPQDTNKDTLTLSWQMVSHNSRCLWPTSDPNPRKVHRFLLLPALLLRNSVLKHAVLKITCL